MNKSRSSRKNRLEKKKRARAYAREMAEKEFKLLLKDFETSGGPRLWKKLEEFSKKGKYQRQLFEYKFKIISDKKWAAMNKKRTKSRQKKETWLDRIARSSSFKPLQGGAPG